jgi:3-dehydroquinate synthetase/nucleoside-diphosphate-sugar epimerase
LRDEPGASPAQRVLVTGGQGFIGRYVVARLLATDPAVTVLALGRSRRQGESFSHLVHAGHRALPAPLPRALCAAFTSPRYHYEPVDLCDRTALTTLVGDFRPTLILHLAGALRDEPLDRLLRDNVQATATLLEALAGSACQPCRIVIASSGAVYGLPAEAGSSFGPRPLGEERPLRPAELYGASKHAAEEVSRVLGARHGLPVLWARIFNAIGPGLDERHFVSTVIAQLAGIAAGLRPPVLEVQHLASTRDFIDVRDVARALMLLGERGEPGRAYNIATGQETPLRQVLDEALRAAASYGMGPEARPEVRIACRPEHAPGISRHVADAGRLRSLGFMPECSLGDSLHEMLRYYREEVLQASRASGAFGVLTAAEAAPEPPPPGDTAGSVVLEVSAPPLPVRYPVEIEAGLLRTAPERLRARFPEARMVLLSDERVQGLHGRDLAEGLRATGLSVRTVLVPEGEGAKDPAVYQRVIDQLHGAGFDRRAVLVNLGGGSVTDLGGFVAATYMRGVRYVNIPTTLLAQHDSAIGGKVAINAPWAKNFVGAFHHPCAVLVDPGVLGTLDARQLAAGVAEAIKVALCGDGVLFELLEQAAGAILERRDPVVLAEVVRRAARRKIALLEPDPYEVDLRRALNLGHSFGHPLETEMAAQGQGILHGEAVAFGLAVAVEVSRARGVCDDQAAERIHGLLRTYGLPPAIPWARLRAACERMSEIRLIRGRQLHYVLPAGIDRVVIADNATDVTIDVTGGEVLRALEALATHPRMHGCVVEDPC